MSKNSGFQLLHPNLTLPRGTESQQESLTLITWTYVQRATALFALVMLSPLITLMWISVKCSSRGPFLFSQKRPGLNGIPFKIYKVRTMKPGAEKQTALGVQRGNPQVTLIGTILRTLKLDELPQLWNVVRGDMALVGPRPIPMALDQELRKNIPDFNRRYLMRPGLTSIGQICVQDNALGDALIDDWKLRFEGELHYMRNRSVSYDIIMIFMTGLFVFIKLFRRKKTQ